jgi:hypothetical protein
MRGIFGQSTAVRGSINFFWMWNQTAAALFFENEQWIDWKIIGASMQI